MNTLNSNWEIQRAKSKYHFDNTVIDPVFDDIQQYGRFVGDWRDEINQVLSSAKPRTWRNRSKTGQPNKLVSEEEYDLESIGADKDMIFANLDYNLSEKFKRMTDIIGLDRREDRVHVQWPGQVIIKHIDKLEKVNPEDPSIVMRFMIMLTDWDQGHFIQYGNYNYGGWHAGDINTFNWAHTPHSTANAGLTPRVSILTTGLVTEKTRQFMNSVDKIFYV